MTARKPPKLQLVKPRTVTHRFDSQQRREEIRRLSAQSRFAGVVSTGVKPNHEADVSTVLRALAGDDKALIAKLAAEVREAGEAADKRADGQFRDDWLAQFAAWDGTDAVELAAEFVEAVVYERRLERWLKIAQYQTNVEGLTAHVSEAVRDAFDKPRATRKGIAPIPGMALLRAAIGALGRLDAKQIDNLLSYKSKQ